METVKDIVRKNITPLSAEMQLGDAIERILASGLTGLPVVDDQGKLVGFLSEQDCIQKMITDTYHCDNRTFVRDLMHNEPLTVGPDESIIDIAQMMSGQKPKVYPVMQDSELLGIICRQDVLKALNYTMKNCVSFA